MSLRVDASLLNALCSTKATIKKNVNLADISNWKVGGTVSVLVQPSSIEQIVELRRLLTQHNTPSLIIGNTTNLLFADENINAVIIQVISQFSEVNINNDLIIAQAGVWVPRLARLAMQAGLTGLEHTCGIPGTLGGLVVMNGGSQRKGIGDSIVYVKTIDADGHIKQYSKKDCKFSYRSSIFQQRDEVIVEVALQLEMAESKTKVHTEMLSILRSRSQKFPRKQPSCGSVFVSNPAMYEQYGPPGKVIEECGFKGMKIGGAQVSPNHANFIVNNGSATAEDILVLINIIRDEVHKKTGYLMEVEPNYVGADGIIKRI